MNLKEDHLKYLQKTDKSFILQKFLNGISKISAEPKHKNRKLYYSRGFAAGTIVHPLKLENGKFDRFKLKETTKHYWQEKDIKLSITESLKDFHFARRTEDFFLSTLQKKQILLDENSENIQKYQDFDANLCQTEEIYPTHFSTQRDNFPTNSKKSYMNSVYGKYLRTPSLFLYEGYVEQTVHTYNRSPEEKRIQIISNILQKISESGRCLNVNALPIKTRFRFKNKLTYSYKPSKNWKGSKSSNYVNSEFLICDSINEMTKDKSLNESLEGRNCKYLSISKQSSDLDDRRYQIMKMVISEICSKAINININYT